MKLVRTYLKMANHGIKDSRLRADDNFMGLPALRSMGDDEIGELASQKGAGDS